jgi:oligopeptide/dipeptide ABC transporter ATP-binding protein
LDVKGLNVEFRTRTETIYAVHELDLTVEPGQILGLVGESGSGKTATSMAILGLVRPPGVVTSGKVMFQGRDLGALKGEEIRSLRGRRISYVPQNPRTALNPLLRIGRQLRNLIDAHSDAATDDVASQCREAIRAVGVPDPDRVLRAYPNELSGGMAQRVVIAMALLLGPDLIVADEPTTGLDVTIQAQILELLAAMGPERGAAVILVTHDLGIVANYCQQVAVIYAGRLVERGTTEQIFRSPQHPYTVGLLRSVPVVGQPLYHMDGQAPHLDHPPMSCSFAIRCAHATSECESAVPPWRGEDGHGVLCCWPESTRATSVVTAR